MEQSLYVSLIWFAAFAIYTGISCYFHKLESDHLVHVIKQLIELAHRLEERGK